jgi:hypothetical protein
MNAYAIAGLTLASVTLALVVLFILCHLPWVALTTALAGAMWCKIIAEKEDQAIAAEVDAIELTLDRDE